MTELMIAISEAVQPFNQVFYYCAFLGAASIILTTIHLNK